MKNLLEFYNKRTGAIDKKDLLTQVGHTIGGRPIDDDQLALMVDHIRSMLAPRQSDRLLDLCCGNGLITSRIAPGCSCTLGVDFTKGLIDIANANFASSDLTFVCQDAKQLDQIENWSAHAFDIVLFYAALQHFTGSDLKKILAALQQLAASPRTIVLGFVPLKTRKWELYDTWAKKASHFKRRLAGTEVITNWWTLSEIEKIAHPFGYSAETIDMPAALSQMNYRFNVRLTKR